MPAISAGSRPWPSRSARRCASPGSTRRIPPLALTSFRISQRFRLPLLAVIGIAAGATVDTPWMAAIVVILGYLLSIPILYWQRERLRARIARAEIVPPVDAMDLTAPPVEQ